MFSFLFFFLPPELFCMISVPFLLKVPLKSLYFSARVFPDSDLPRHRTVPSLSLSLRRSFRRRRLFFIEFSVFTNSSKFSVPLGGHVCFRSVHFIRSAAKDLLFLNISVSCERKHMKFYLWIYCKIVQVWCLTLRKGLLSSLSLGKLVCCAFAMKTILLHKNKRFFGRNVAVFCFFSMLSCTRFRHFAF